MYRSSSNYRPTVVLFTSHVNLDKNGTDWTGMTETFANLGDKFITPVFAAIGAVLVAILLVRLWLM
jgi:hypothetical protein